MKYDLSVGTARNTLIVACVFTGLAVIATILRIMSKRLRKARLMVDDFLILTALALLFASLGIFASGLTSGLGRHLRDVQRNDFVKILKLTLPFRILYGLEMTLVKMAIITFYFRLFGSIRSFRLSAYFVAILVLLCGATVILEVLLVCIPFSKNWNVEKQGTCMHTREMYVATGSVNIATDILLMGLPIPYILSMRIDLKRKLGIIAMFSLGVFNTAVSILRMRTLLMNNPQDLTFGLARVYVWSILDPCVCLINADLPMIKTYFMLVAPKVFGSASDGASGNARQNMAVLARIVVPGEHRDVNGSNTDESEHGQSNALAEEGLITTRPKPFEEA
ncbi:hypothetical protein BJ875DRAFT_246451 [Amylocarpus encephaloides]|uniref:Rhodopsin domain-containing protein n=1 Tax=Amylocarpus encephaloides TaxID=45428 RepID=A0A9P8C8H3_9HELO|nr:hypothetical protein BJ875DRAFT_246451 [Amylocarpus encephaloides]